MKHLLSTLLLLLVCSVAPAQAWLSAPYMEIKTEGDKWKRQNFYEIQAAFRRYEVEMERQYLPYRDQSAAQNERHLFRIGKNKHWRIPIWENRRALAAL